MFGLEDQLASLVTPRVAGPFGSLGEDADLRGVSANQDGLPRQLRQDGVAVAIEFDPRVGSHDGRNDFIRIEGDRRQGP